MRATFFSTVVVACTPMLLSAAEPVSFTRDVRTLLSNNCFKCHGPDFKKGGLDLQSFAEATKKLESGKASIVPGDPMASELVKRITSTKEEYRMPPKGDPLKPEQVATLKAWIEQGAKYEGHWAYTKPVKPAEPKVKAAMWVRNPIDAHVLARLEKEGLTPATEAEKTTLIRRATLDLTGLPPTVEEVDAFLKDNTPHAYETVIDRLLTSRAYGEHMARWWLDLARYADTNGYEKDERRTIWPYRDWVIDAFNRDLPFDEFSREQIAGDLIPNATVQQRIATGFHRNTMVNTEGGTDDEEFRVAAIVDRVNTTMAVWMGTTIACAQCHNHKYDPFSTKEYYQLFSFFNQTTDRGRSNDPQIPVPTHDEVERRALAQAKTIKPVVALLGVHPVVVAGLAKPAGEQSVSAFKLSGGIKSATTMVLQELPRPRDTHIYLRGNHKALGDKVGNGFPAKLHPLNTEPSPPRNRLSLANWLVSPENPLVGRVTMNRIWGRFFGRGLVETSEDFGIQGELPTHPELLDFLAVELIDRKWSLKALQKLIVMSATYRQSSRVTKELLERDPANRWYARGPRFRLDAEMVRDNALAISGLLQRKVGGPSVFPFQPDGVWANPYSGDRWIQSDSGNQHRRGLYTFWRRTAPYAAFMAFDAPSREVTCDRRPRTNTPLQALATLNDRTFVECSNALARRMMKESPAGINERITHGFRLCVSRMPTEMEQTTLRRLFEGMLEKYRADPADAKRLAAIAGPIPDGMNVAELAAWTVIANLLLNLDETITKG